MSGGVILNRACTALTITNSTFDYDTSHDVENFGYGSQFYFGPINTQVEGRVLDISHSTLVGGGIYFDCKMSAVQVTNTVIDSGLHPALSKAGPANPPATIISKYNAVTTPGQLPIDETSHVASCEDFGLLPLADNGGPTLTRLPGDLLIDAGDPVMATEASSEGSAISRSPVLNGSYEPATDQRGLPRVRGGLVDIGADGPASVSVTTSDGTAIALDRDYLPVSATISWASGDNVSKFITVKTFTTDTAEPITSFGVGLSNPSARVSIVEPGAVQGHIVNVVDPTNPPTTPVDPPTTTPDPAEPSNGSGPGTGTGAAAVNRDRVPGSGLAWSGSAALSLGLLGLALLIMGFMVAHYRRATMR